MWGEGEGGGDLKGLRDAHTHKKKKGMCKLNASAIEFPTFHTCAVIVYASPLNYWLLFAQRTTLALGRASFVTGCRLDYHPRFLYGRREE